jgi:hypothetical protein
VPNRLLATELKLGCLLRTRFMCEFMGEVKRATWRRPELIDFSCEAVEGSTPPPPLQKNPAEHASSCQTVKYQS